MNNSKTTYLSIGSNLGSKLNNLQEAVFAIQKKTGFITELSAVYQTPALGFEGEDFLNACLSLQTFLSPEQLLAGILEVETSLGRKRGNEVGYQPRTIDIDILYYGQEVIQTENLVIPHPNLHKRRFVLRPLSDIAPQFYHPIINKDTRNLLQECPDKSVMEKTQLKLYKSKEDLFSKLQFITIEGNIGAGKTTLANMIADDFNAKPVLERFADNPFLPKFYEDQSRYAFPLEMSFLADRYQQFTDDTSQFDLFKNFMISDYDIYKSLIFANITLQKEEFSLYRKVFTFMHKEIKKPDIFIYLYQNSERLLSNIKKRGRDYEQNISTDYLDKINRGYLDFIKSSPERKSLIIDVSKLDFVQNQKDYEYILDEIQKFTVSLP
ncbi:2-amino-4-hydroxy-6-hydroxymethyldihydropteridine diphosphokinase [Flavobacteriaceae bacterium KMM 6898]|nr:2-amino-4-hydroxy-6-hydroxymethyldihydropteridine diphosphokinase [Flavobacteriaceae bacterium KMM 6898]